MARAVAAALTTMLPAVVVEGARADSSVFVDAFFGYESAQFQKDWHREWNRPSAHVVQWSPVEHGKTQQATGWALHRLGSDHKNTRILWVGSAISAARKSVGIIKEAIEKPHPVMAAVFPQLAPGNRKWTETQFSVKDALATEKDYSVEAAGVGGQILGGRFTIIVLDDTCTFQTTYTALRRAEMSRWVASTVLGRLLPGGRILVLGNAWYPDDLMHMLAERGFRSIRNEAYQEDESGNLIPKSILWPEQFPVDRLGRTSNALRVDGSPSKRRELGTVEAQRQLRCIAYQAGQGRFLMEWFDRAMEAGAGLVLVDQYDGHAGPAYGGADLGVGEKEGNDPSAFWCFAQQPDGRRRLLNGMEERLLPSDLVAELADWYRRYGGIWKVENNAAQEFLRQWVKTKGIPTRPHTTGKNKADPSLGVPSLAVELEQGMWILPSGDERSIALATKWRSQCLAWAPGEHTGDLLMASWFAREAARRGEQDDAGAAPQGTERPSPWAAAPQQDSDDEDERPARRSRMRYGSR